MSLFYFHASMFGWILETIFPQNVGGISFCLLVSSDAFEKPDDAILFTLFSSLDDGPWCGVFFVNWISTLWALSTCRVISLIYLFYSFWNSCYMDLGLSDPLAFCFCFPSSFHHLYILFYFLGEFLHFVCNSFH